MNKVGYTYDEILEFMTEGEGRAFLGKSMYDAIRETIEEKDKEIERLRAREQECVDKYLNMSKYASEIEGKYILEKAKNEKAIEYVEKSKLNQLDTYCKYLYINYSTESIEHLDELLNILEGDDNNV